MQNIYQIEAQRVWDNAHRRALWSRLLDNMKGGANHLIDFNEVAERLSLKNTVYRGTQIIPLDHIVGSVGRYADFTRAFLPVHDAMSQRWRSVASIVLDPHSKGAPPIEVYKVRDWYFVKDGNHRVSVHRQLGDRDIEAYVWEYTEPLPEVGPDMDIDTFLIEAERKDFFQHTNLDQLRPDHNIQLTLAGGYTEMLYRIASYQDALSVIDETSVSYSEAVTAWYDMIYEAAVQIIEKDGVMTQFPGRTVADLFVWTIRHQAELLECCGPLHLEHVISDLKQPKNKIEGVFDKIKRVFIPQKPM